MNDSTQAFTDIDVQSYSPPAAEILGTITSLTAGAAEGGYDFCSGSEGTHFAYSTFRP